jgi:hypothetical protein
MDQVSFGSARRQLPLVPMPVPLQSPWHAGQNPVVEIPSADVFEAAPMTRSTLPVVIPRGGFHYIFIDLWSIFKRVNTAWK